MIPYEHLGVDHSYELDFIAKVTNNLMLLLEIKGFEAHGQASPAGFWYDQDQHEWVSVLQGAARLRFEDQTIELKPGDFVNIPAHKKHRVEWTTPDEPTIWLAVHYGDGE